jgi:protocatechuate 3,4-dioxygenase beta subunit
MRGLREPLALVACCAGLIVISQAGSAQPAAADTQCPATNVPNTLTLAGGTPQTAQRGTAFTAGLQVTLANTNGCPVTTALAGTPIVFTAPSSGPSGTFAASGSDTLTVGADTAGNASAPGFTANALAGTYGVTASSAYGSVSFTLTNSASGIAATIVPLTPTPRSAPVGARYAQPLSVRVLDADGAPVAGATVNFTLGAQAAAGAGATFSNGSSQATATTNGDGVATSPSLTANTTAGSFAATATTPNVASPVRVHLRNRAGRPANVAAGAAAAESAQAGTRFTIPLAVLVTDAHHNPVANVPVTFTAPAAGASGHFSRRSHPTRVTVRTDAAGIAVTPPFVANTEQGGYVVTATVRGVTRAAAFALVNDGS